ncbi:MAG: hypothetical protein H7Z16_14905 [Pyrinomonadaceae bacterium]|nr:hypothetical protein [Pyrinomonadaceae bacterium]
MSKILSTLVSPTGLLYIFVALTQVAQGVYLASDFEPNPALTLLYTFGFIWIIGWWLMTDSRKREVKWVFDMGLFLYLAWPFVMPYYLIKTRGARGLLVILGFVGAYVGSLILGATLYVLLVPTVA